MSTPVKRRPLFFGVPEQQKIACSLRYGGPGPNLSYPVIAQCMGICLSAAHKLVKKGTARIQANGYRISDLSGQADRS